jgi:clan AA aspartic protease
MGLVNEEITLKNVRDKMKAEEGYINESEIRQTTVQAVVDTGAMTLVINEQLRQELGLGVVGEREATLADSTKRTVKIVEAVEIHWKNRFMTCQPWVVSAGKILLGAIPLENMDLMVDPNHQKLVGVHGDEEVCILF